MCGLLYAAPLNWRSLQREVVHVVHFIPNPQQYWLHQQGLFSPLLGHYISCRCLSTSYVQQYDTSTRVTELSPLFFLLGLSCYHVRTSTLFAFIRSPEYDTPAARLESHLGRTTVSLFRTFGAAAHNEPSKLAVPLPSGPE